MKRWVCSALFLAAAALAACGGGTGRVVPGSGQQPVAAPPIAARSTKAEMIVKIPPAMQQHTRKRPFYISPGTQSFAIGVAHPGSTPQPSTAQIFPIATPSPCAAQSGGGDVCTFLVTAPYGNDVFYVAAFATASPGPNATPLSTFVSGVVDVSATGGTPPPLQFSMNAVPNSASVSVASPDPGNTPNTQVFPIGVATTAPLAVTVYDASGNSVLNDPTTPFAGPISLSLTPASAGLTLSLTGSSPCGSTASGATASLLCPADLNAIAVAYDGSIQLNAANNPIDGFSIVAAPTASPAPTPASVVLASNVFLYPTTFTTNVGSGLLVPVTPSQLLYVVSNGAASVGTFNSTTGATTAAVAVSGFGLPTSVAVSPNGTVWATDAITTPAVIDCWSSLANFEAGSPATLSGYAPMFNGSDVMSPFAVAVDKNNDVWIQAEDPTTGIDYLLEYNQTTTSCSPPATFTAATSVNIGSNSQQQPAPITALPNANGVAFTTTDSGVARVTTANLGSTVSLVPPVTAGTNSTGDGIAADAQGNVFTLFALTGSSYDLEELAAGGSANSRLLFLPPNASVNGLASNDGSLSVFGPSGGAADRALFRDSGFNAVGIAGNFAAPLSELVSVPSPSRMLATAFGPNGERWAMYQANAGSNFNLVFARVVNTTTWAVPSITANEQLGCANQFVMSVNERADSGPFTVTTTSSGATLTPFPVFDPHDFVISLTGTSPVSVPVTIVDKNGRTQTIIFVASYTLC